MRENDSRPVCEPREFQLIREVLKSTEEYSHEEINNFFNELRKEIIERRIKRIRTLEEEIGMRQSEIGFANETMKSILTAQI